MSSFISRHTTGLSFTAGVFAMLLVGAFVFGWFGGITNNIASMQPDVSTPEAAYDAGAPRANTSGSGGGSGDTDAVNVSERKVIRNGSLSMVVNNINSTADEITSIANNSGGFLESSDISDRGTEQVEASLVIRVPAEAFNNVFSEVKSLAVQVRDERTNARDVTDRFVDLQARLRNAKRTEEQYLAILEQAESVEDTLQVQERLSETREEIERLEAQQTQLDRQIEMATIDISLISKGDVEILGVVWSPINQIKQGLNGMIDGVIGFVNNLIAIIFALPVIILWTLLVGGLLGGMWKIGLWVKHRFWDVHPSDDSYQES